MNTQITTWNTNGLRGVLRKSLSISFANSDVVLLQEVRASVSQLQALEPSLGGTHTWYWHQAERPGYSGVGIGLSSKYSAEDVRVLEYPWDTEGRLLVLLVGKQALVSAYAPAIVLNGLRDAVRAEYYSKLNTIVSDLITDGYSVILGGDLNILPEELDTLGLPLVSVYTGTDPTYKDRVLDYVLITADLVDTVVSSSVTKTSLSDHNPIRVVLSE